MTSKISMGSEKLSDRPEVRRWLSNVIYAFVTDQANGEPTEAEITGELDALEALLDRRTPPREAPSAAPQQTAGEAPAQCMACSHGPERHTPECDCGCWGFFRAGARRCDNPLCEGSGCIANDVSNHDHGPNDLGGRTPVPQTKGEPTR